MTYPPSWLIGCCGRSCPESCCQETQPGFSKWVEWVNKLLTHLTITSFNWAPMFLIWVVIVAEGRSWWKGARARGGRTLVAEGHSWRKGACSGRAFVAEGRPPWWRDALRGGGTPSVVEGRPSWRWDADGLCGGGTDFVAEGRTSWRRDGLRDGDPSF